MLNLFMYVVCSISRLFLQEPVSLVTASPIGLQIYELPLTTVAEYEIIDDQPRKAVYIESHTGRRRYTVIKMVSVLKRMRNLNRVSSVLYLIYSEV